MRRLTLYILISHSFRREPIGPTAAATLRGLDTGILVTQHILWAEIRPRHALQCTKYAARVI